MPPAGYFCHQTKVPKSWLRGLPPENPLLAAGAVGWSVGIGQCPTCGSEGGNWERSGHSRPALWRAPSLETPGFCVLSSYFCTAGGKFDRTANKNTPPQEPAAKREGRVQNNPSVPGFHRDWRNCCTRNSPKINQPLPAPHGVFRGEAPELIFAYFCSGTKVGRPGGETP